MKATFISNESLGAILSARIQDVFTSSEKRRRAVVTARVVRLLRELELIEALEEPFWVGWGTSHLGHVGAIVVQGDVGVKIHATAPERIRITDVTEEVMNEASSK